MHDRVVVLFLLLGDFGLRLIVRDHACVVILKLGEAVSTFATETEGYHLVIQGIFFDAVTTDTHTLTPTSHTSAQIVDMVVGVSRG